MSVRKATAKDMDAVLQLIQELAAFEKEPDAVRITKDTLIAHGTGEHPLFTCFVAENEQGIVGMALVYFRFSTWQGKSLHLEDLIVSKLHRGKGYGKALYDRVMTYAKEQKAQRVEWVVLDWNKGAIDFYDRSGATFLKNWYLVQMDKVQLDAYLKTIN